MLTNPPGHLWRDKWTALVDHSHTSVTPSCSPWEPGIRRCCHDGVGKRFSLSLTLSLSLSPSLSLSHSLSLDDSQAAVRAAVSDAGLLRQPERECVCERESVCVYVCVCVCV